MNDKNTNDLPLEDINKIKKAIASGTLTPDLVNMNDYSDIDNMFYEVEIKNIREAAILALAICKCSEVQNTEIIVFNAKPVMFDEDSVTPLDYLLKDEKKLLELLTADGKEAEFVKEYKHLLYHKIASGVHVLGDVFGIGKYRLTYGYLKDEDGATAQISFAGNPRKEAVEELLDQIFAEFEMLRDYLRETK